MSEPRKEEFKKFRNEDLIPNKVLLYQVHGRPNTKQNFNNIKFLR